MAFSLKGKAENFHPIPAVRRMREKHMPEKGEATDTESSQHGAVTRTEVEKRPDGTAHVKAHHEDGHVATHHHPHAEAAQEHAHNLMTGGPQAYDQLHGDQAEQDCPECGGKMEAGKCTQCGYESPEEQGESKEFEAGEKEGAEEY